MSVKANSSRGGIVGTDADIITPVFTGVFVQPPEITGLSLTNGVFTVLFAGGELEKAPSVAGPWKGTGETNGKYSETIEGVFGSFFRVRSP